MNFSLFSRLSVLAFTIFFINTPISFAANPPQIQDPSIQKKLAELEAASGGRLGVYAINTENDARIQFRSDERFPFASTGKVMVVAAILKESEKNPEILQKQITYSQEDVDKSEYAPITQQYVSSGMRVHELCKAAIEYSDNLATNLLVKTLGGPEAVTAYARSIHDNTFRLDWWEPNLTAPPGDPHDTTTPKSMAESLKRLVLDDSLGLPQREQLKTWLINTTTGNTKIRAGVPKGWVVGNKTGNGIYGTTNDIAIVWPSKGGPVVLVVYVTQKEKDAVKRDDIIPLVTRIALNVGGTH